MYSNVAVSLALVSPLALSLETLLKSSKWDGTIDLQPRVHKMRSVYTKVIEERIHRNFPETRQLGFTLACVSHIQTIVGHSIVKGIRPKGICTGISNRDGSRCTGVVSELGLIKEFKGLARVVEKRSTEALNGVHGDTSQSIQGNKVAIDFVCRR